MVTKAPGSRMFDVGPRGSGAGGGGRPMSDRELMQNVIEAEDIKRLLRNSPMRPSGRNGNLKADDLAGMIRRASRRPTVPSSRALAHLRKAGPKAWVDIARGEVSETLREILGYDLKSVGKWKIPGVRDDNGWQFLNRNPSYDGTAPLTGAGQGWVAASEGTFNHSFHFNAQNSDGTDYLPLWNTSALPRDLWNIAPEVGTGDFHSVDHWHSSGVGTRSKPTYTRPAIRASALLFAGPQLTPKWERDVNTLPRARRPNARIGGFRKAATDRLVVPGPNGELRWGGPPVNTVHREVPTKSEKKTSPKVGALIGAYHKLTEINDLVDALAEAIPGNPCGGMPGFHKLLCVLNNFGDIDPETAVYNIAANEIEDQLVGRAQGKLASALKKARASGHGPNATQLQQFARNLPKLKGL